MDLSLNDEQKLLADSVARFFAKAYTPERRRTLVESELGYARENWKQFAALGWLGIGIPEELGGIGGGPVETAIVMEGIGRHLAPEPYLTSAVIGGALLGQGGNGAAGLLSELAAGNLTLALTHGEPKSRFDLAHVETRAARHGNGFKLTGHKSVAQHAQSADKLIVSGRSAGGAAETQGITLFLLPRDAAGITLMPYRTRDGSRAADVKLDGVVAGADQVLGPVDGGHALVESAVEKAIVALAAEAVGAMEALLALTKEYLKTRKQFGVPIGSFQVLQHRLVDMFMALELARSTTEMAARALSDPDPRYRARAAAAAKAQAGRAGRLVAQEAVQLHGGMGMTDELAVGHYFKRLMAIDIGFGNTGWHQRRFADLA